jgi:hypothetical protein
MKQKILNLKKKLLLVEIGGELSTEFLAIMNEHGMAEILGKLTDITEEQFKEWVESFGQNGYMNYLSGSQYSELLKPTAKESFFSYLESHGIYFENPFGKIEPELSEDDLWGDMAQDSQVYAGILYKKDKWQEAEQKVWSKDSCYIFEII